MSSEPGDINPSSPPGGLHVPEVMGVVPGIGEPCRFAVPDQRGGLVCMKNQEAPGWCDPDRCPHGGPFR